MNEYILEVNNVRKYFDQKRNIKEIIYGQKSQVQAVDGVSFSIKQNETFGLVGESGCGKSTLARTILNLFDDFEGDIEFENESISSYSGKEYSKNVQIVFQDPYDSLNPRMKVGDIIKEPLVIQDIGSEKERNNRVEELLDQVGLDATDAKKYPHQFSGGQQQRVGIARALALNPKLLIADEPVSSLDVSEQARILNLLDSLKDQYGLSILFIAHDLGVIRYICDRTAVMYLGKIMEIGDTDRLFTSPSHPYTESLISAIPHTDPDQPWNPANLDETKIPDPSNPPEGCNFCTRCPIAEEKCFNTEPPLEATDSDLNHKASCFFPIN